MVAYLLVFYYLPILDHDLVLFTRLFFESGIDKTCPFPISRGNFLQQPGFGG